MRRHLPESVSVALACASFSLFLPSAAWAEESKQASTDATRQTESSDKPKAEAAGKPIAKPVVTISAEEDLGKVFLKLHSQKLVDGSKGEADGMLRAVPWRNITQEGASAPLVRFSFGAEFKRGSSVVDALEKAGEKEPFFVEQRILQGTAEDCKALLKLIASLESAKFEKAPEGVKYRAVSAGYGDFRFKKLEDGKVEIFAYVASVGEIWAPVELPALKKMIGGLVEQLEGFAKAPQSISLK
jgi:hypothetical protein